MNAKVAKSFLHANTGILWKAGETFRGDASTVRQLVRKGFLQGDGAPRGDDADLAALTVAELRALCKQRGIDVPNRATKVKILNLLGA